MFGLRDGMGVDHTFTLAARLQVVVRDVRTEGAIGVSRQQLQAIVR